MIGILVVTHGNIAAELVEAARFITGDTDRIESVGIRWDQDPEDARRQIEEALERLAAGAGVLVLTDMFGGTASNLALPFLREGRVEIVTGANLPMLLKSLAARRDEPLGALARAARDRGQKAIEVASDLLAESAPARDASPE
jgi:PTS system mannose-specific IIA component